MHCISDGNTFNISGIPVTNGAGNIGIIFDSQAVLLSLLSKEIQEELNRRVQLSKFESLNELVHLIELYQSERKTKMP